MSTQIQRRGGTTAEHASFVGASREVTVDTTKQTLVVHDGITAGGTPLAKEVGLDALALRVGTNETDILALQSAPGGGGSRLPRLVIIGDSTTAQQMVQGNSWVDILRDMMLNTPKPYEVINLAVNQLTFYRARLAHSSFGGQSPLASLIDLEPDVVIVSLGGNDGIMNLDGRTLAQIKDDATSFLASIKSSLPLCKIIYLRPDWWDRTNNDTVTSSKNKYFMPVHWKLGTTTAMANRRAVEWSDTDIDSTQADKYKLTRDLVTHVSGSPDVDGTIKHPLWKVQRLGCAGPDLLHPTPVGHRFIASSVMTQLRTSMYSVLGWPGALTLTDPNFNDFDTMFTGVMKQEGGEWVMRDSIDTAVIHSISDENHWLINPWAWYCRHKLWISSNAIAGSSIATTELLVWSIWNAQPFASVDILAPSLGVSSFTHLKTTTYRGDVMHVGDVQAYSPGDHLVHFSVGQDVMPGVYLKIT